ncbi:MAG: Holliday junction branch migration protein RuvA [Nitrospinae bacterium]|nr:Holliday junction branch migration protein RuvA [Nitrospinota bacterium]
MIAKLTGTLVTKALDHVIVDVVGVGYRVFIPLSTYYDLPEVSTTVSLLIHMHVREDTLHLFGFLTVDERDLFEALLRVTKVGPKLALAMLSGMSPGDLQKAVLEGDVPRLSAVPGVGRKTAERIVLELREKLAKGKSGLAGGLVSRADGQQVIVDAVTALLHLGYPRAVAERTLGQVQGAQRGETPPLKDLIRAALRLLGQEKGH